VRQADQAADSECPRKQMEAIPASRARLVARAARCRWRSAQLKLRPAAATSARRALSARPGERVPARRPVRPAQAASAPTSAPFSAWAAQAWVRSRPRCRWPPRLPAERSAPRRGPVSAWAGLESVPLCRVVRTPPAAPKLRTPRVPVTVPTPWATVVPKVAAPVAAQTRRTPTAARARFGGRTSRLPAAAPVRLCRLELPTRGSSAPTTGGWPPVRLLRAPWARSWSPGREARVGYLLADPLGGQFIAAAGRPLPG
jgi:hypothetical protein